MVKYTVKNIFDEFLISNQEIFSEDIDKVELFVDFEQFNFNCLFRTHQLIRIKAIE